MSERVRPTTPVGIPDEVSGVLERMTNTVRLRPVTHDSPNTKSEPRNVVHATSRVGRRPGSVGSNVRKMTPTVNYPGYREMISRLQEEAADDIQLRTRNLIEARLTSPVSSTRDMEEDDLTFRQYDDGRAQYPVSSTRDMEEDDLTFRQYDDDRAQYQVSNDQQDNNHFFTGFNSSKKKPKTKYYAVRRGRNTGLFHDWKSCEQQVEGYSNSEFKSFQNERDALEYLAEARVYDKSEYGEKASGSMLSQPLSRQEHEEHRFSHQIRNDAVGPIPNTALRRNVTQRRSHGRAKDRTSIGETSVPLEMLISRKLHPRDKDVEYQHKAQLTTPSQHQSSSHEIKHREDEEDLDIPVDFHRLWRRKTQIDGELMAALQAQDESTYRSLEVEQLDINSQIYSKVFASTSAITPPDTPLPSDETGTTQELTPDFGQRS
jgi:hypothetical protein